MKTHVRSFGSRLSRRCLHPGLGAAVSLLWLAVASSALSEPERPGEVLNFCLLDHRGRAHELRRMDAKAVVLFFTANECPIARQSIPKLLAVQEKYAGRGVRVFLVNSSPGDDRASIRKEARELNAYHLPVLKDDTQGVARHLKVRRTGETFVISTANWQIVYHGAIDDQFVEGAQKPQPTVRYLHQALDEFLAGKPVGTADTAGRGCLIHFEAAAKWSERDVSYAQEVAPILQRKCVECHGPGEVGAWRMSGHRKVKSMASMIEEVVLARRMPPWDADPEGGPFSNSAALTVSEAQTLLRWIEQGAPRGEGGDPLETRKPEAVPDWPLGPPDIVLKLPKREIIPATGVLDYRHVLVEAGNAEERWVGAVWVRPGNRKVVHHVLARFKGSGFKDHLGNREMLAGWAPGTTQGWLPKGTGKLLPKQACVDLELHYTTCGTEETDQTEIGLYLLNDRPDARYESVPVVNTSFEIPPGAPNHEVLATYGFTQGATLYSVTPHMHFRGKWMKFDLLLPSGERKQVCSVPRYDFNWQLTYVLQKPLRIPPGAWVLLTGGFDNSATNPANPDPAKTIRWGEQTWDEMFLGWYNVAWDEPFVAPTASR
jgi:hypothetical protein